MPSFYFRFFFLIAIFFLFFAGCGSSSHTHTSYDTTAFENPVFAGVPVSDDVKKEVWARDQGKCVLCQSTKDLGYQHKVHPKDGGKSVASNLEVRCRACED